MKRPFTVGDRLYLAGREAHVIFGGYYIDNDPKAQPTHVYYCMDGQPGYYDTHIGHLSFSPWGKPNHTRPFVPTLKGGEHVLVQASDGGPRTPVGYVVKEETAGCILMNNGKRYPKDEYDFFLPLEKVERLIQQAKEAKNAPD